MSDPLFTDQDLIGQSRFMAQDRGDCPFWSDVEYLRAIEDCSKTYPEDWVARVVAVIAARSVGRPDLAGAISAPLPPELQARVLAAPIKP